MVAYVWGMEKFKNGDVVIKSEGLKHIFIIVSWANGDGEGNFQGTVIKSDFDFYKVGEHSRTWHEDKFELAPKGVEISIIT